MKVHFSMAFLLQICCNSSEQLFIRAAPLCIVVSDFKITVIYIDADYLDCPNNCWFLDICLLIVCRTKHSSIKGEQNFILFISSRVNIITKSNNINIKDRQYIKNFRKIVFFFWNSLYKSSRSMYLNMIYIYRSEFLRFFCLNGKYIDKK